MAYVPDSLFRSNHEETHFQTSSQDFHGVSEFLMRRSMSFSGMDRVAAEDQLQPEDEVSDDGSAQMLGEKKRRLNLEQVRALEKSFELGNKLEPERKMQLARALALQPRQVAIWFQNRRARWKTKQLERDYDVLKRQYEAIKADNESLKSQNKRLQSQLMAMKARDSKGSGRINLNKENEGSWSNGSDDNSCEVNLNNTTSTDSTLYHHQNQDGNNGSNGAVLFPNPATDLIQLLQGSSNSRADENIPLRLCHKIQNSTPPANEGFCNMFTAIEENPDFWPWSEHQNFH